MAKILEKDAVKVMKKAGLNPLVPYPGAGVNWKCKCLKCKNIVSPRLASIKRGGGCVGCSGLLKVSAEDAKLILQKANIEPISEFPGYRKKWKSRCLTCKKIIYPAASSVKIRGKGCIYCGYESTASKKRFSEKEAVRYMKEKGLTPLEKYKSVNVPWKCIHLKCGKIVKPRLAGIRAGESGCKYCSGKFLEPKKAKKLMIDSGFFPLEPYPGGNRKLWKCLHQKCESVVSVKYNQIQQGTKLCQNCSPTSKLSDKVARDFFLQRGLKPLLKYKSSATPWKSIHISCGKEVSPTYASIQQGGIGCAHCAGNIKISDTEAREFFESKELIPIEKYPGAGSPWESIHTRCGKKVTPRYSDVKKGGGGCGFCGGSKVDIADAPILMRDNGFEPLVPYPGADSKWKCKHINCGNVVYPRYTNVKRGEGGCLHCAGKVPIDPLEAEKLFLSKGFMPKEPFRGTHYPWVSVHKICGKTISPRYKAVRAGLAGCKYCSGNKVDAIDAVAIFESKGIHPIEPFSYTHRPWKSVHIDCGRQISPTYADVVHANGGCKFCATKGIDLTTPAHFYLITNEILGAHKIGISGEKTKRLQVHAREGWTVFKKVLFSTGEIAYQIEQETLLWLRDDVALPPYLSPDLMPQGGWTETVDASEIDLPTIWLKVEELSKKSRKAN